MGVGERWESKGRTQRVTSLVVPWTPVPSEPVRQVSSVGRSQGHHLDLPG